MSKDRDKEKGDFDGARSIHDAGQKGTDDPQFREATKADVLELIWAALPESVIVSTSHGVLNLTLGSEETPLADGGSKVRPMETMMPLQLHVVRAHLMAALDVVDRELDRR